MLTKIKSCDDTNKILIKLYGEDILNKIISPDLDENLLSNIENTIKEIDEFKKSHGDTYNKTKQNSINNNSNSNNANNLYNKITPNFKENVYNNEFNRSNNFRKINNNNNSYYNINNLNTSNNNNNNIRKENNSFYTSENLLARNYSERNLSKNNMKRNLSNSRSTINISTKNNSRSKSKNKFEIFESNNSNELNDKSFENILRKYGGRQITGKVFMNYSKKNGQYFDASLQKGGVSSLDIKDLERTNMKRSNSRKTIGNHSTLSISNI